MNSSKQRMEGKRERERERGEKKTKEHSRGTISIRLDALASYRRIASRSASYPALMATTATSDATRLAADVTRHCRNTMQSPSVDHVKSIWRGCARTRKKKTKTAPTEGAVFVRVSRVLE